MSTNPYRMVDGQKVYLTNQEILDLQADQLQQTNDALSTMYIYQRRDAYPAIGDQLDAILKQLNSMGIVLVPDMDNIIKQWLKVKNDYPKPA